MYPYPPIVSKCLSYFGVRTYTPASSHPWNAWVEDYEAKGNWRAEKPVLSSFETGAYTSAVMHLLNCRKCRRLNRIRLGEVKKILAQLDEDWKRVTE